MKIADLSERISVRNYVTKRSERGDILSTVEFERCRVWAKVLPLAARNNDAQPEQANKITYRVTIRYRAGIKPDDEIVWRERRLKLISPPYDLDGRRIFTAFDCEEVIANGET
ncbi:MAG: phage head closure protein [Selenomonadaceae bacterium]|nr:phage head closure protein [Selenomonadaceae bacterium]